jgi:hypothetical protein
LTSKKKKLYQTKYSYQCQHMRTSW